MEGLTHHDRPGHQQRAPVAEFPKFPPVVLVAVQLPVLLIVPVGEGLLAFRTPGRQDKETLLDSWNPRFSDPVFLNLSRS